MKKWKIVFGIAAFLCLSDLIMLPFKADVNIFSFIGPIANGIVWLPMYGYAYQKAIGTKPIAISIFIVSVLMAVYAFLGIAIMSYDNGSIATFILISIVLFSVLVVIYSQFMYAFKSDHLWKKKHNR